jgi:hypothetical protein
MLMEMAMKSMEMVVESMESIEMAPGALPCPGRVLEQRLLSPKIGLRWRRCCETFLGKTLIDLGFLHRRIFVGGGAMSEGSQGAPHHRVACRAVHLHHHLVWSPPGPLRLFFGLCLVSGENRNFGLCFVQF